MTLKLPPKIVCALVWLLLVMVPLLLLAGILLPWTSQIAELNERIATGEDQLARYRRLLQTLPGLQAELEQVRSNDAFKAFYFSASTPALAGAQLQSQVQTIVTAAKGSLVSTQLLPEEKSENPPCGCGPRFRAPPKPCSMSCTRSSRRVRSSLWSNCRSVPRRVPICPAVPVACRDPRQVN